MKAKSKKFTTILGLSRIIKNNSHGNFECALLVDSNTGYLYSMNFPKMQFPSSNTDKIIYRSNDVMQNVTSTKIYSSILDFEGIENFPKEVFSY